MRYLIEFSYNGTNYFGFQTQPQQISVQQVLEEKWSLLLKKEIKIVGAGRTDSGVHAKKMFAHFDYEGNLMPNFVQRSNSILPSSIAVHSVQTVGKDFHARFTATSRSYQYHLSTCKNPFTEQLTYYYFYGSLDVAAMNKSCEYLMQYTDFTSFSKVNTDTFTNDCNIYHAYWEINADQLVFYISANRFLRNMVRSIVGTMLSIGAGKRKAEDINAIIQSKNRQNAGVSVPACGLYLVDVTYPEGLIK